MPAPSTSSGPRELTLNHCTHLSLVQVLVTAVAGYFFYLIRRASGGLVVLAVLHGLRNFGLISGLVVAGQTYADTSLFVLADIVLAIIVVAGRHRIEPAGARGKWAGPAAGRFGVRLSWLGAPHRTGPCPRGHGGVLSGRDR
jgi:hypothetical protein